MNSTNSEFLPSSLVKIFALGSCSLTPFHYHQWHNSSFSHSFPQKFLTNILGSRRPPPVSLSQKSSATSSPISISIYSYIIFLPMQQIFFFLGPSPPIELHVSPIQMANPGVRACRYIILSLLIIQLSTKSDYLFFQLIILHENNTIVCLFLITQACTGQQ